MYFASNNILESFLLKGLRYAQKIMYGEANNQISMKICYRICEYNVVSFRRSDYKIKRPLLLGYGNAYSLLSIETSQVYEKFSYSDFINPSEPAFSAKALAIFECISFIQLMFVNKTLFAACPFIFCDGDDKTSYASRCVTLLLGLGNAYFFRYISILRRQLAKFSHCHLIFPFSGGLNSILFL